MRTMSHTVLVFSWLFVIVWVSTDAFSYDYTSITECLTDPVKPQYDGGIIVNPEINDGLNGWTTHGGVKIEHRMSANGNNFIVAHSRKHYYGSVSQKGFILEKEKLYIFSAWVQIIGKRNTPVMVIFKTNEGFKPAGSVVAQVGCWSMLKGGITVESSSPSEFYFQTNETSIDIWIDSVSLQPFTLEQWKSHQYQSIEKVRKAKVRLQVVDSIGRAMPYANISIKQNKASFPIGASINYNILNNTLYQKWFISKFPVTTFENEMKWYSTGYTPGKEDYSVLDAMFDFTSRHGILVRGHNIFWDNVLYQPAWIKNLSLHDLQEATNKRLNSLVTRFAGKVIAWDVNNEILHHNYFESKLGANITNVFFQRTLQLDRHTSLFMNDYNTIEDVRDPSAFPSKYLQTLKEIQDFLGGEISLGIGLEGHFITPPNIPYVRSALDTLASSKLPIWITELDVRGGSNQVSYFEQILRELHSHPAIQGIIIWGPWSPKGQCYQMCLVDPNFKNLPTGDVIVKLMIEWGHDKTFIATTDANGFFNTSLFHGDYQVKFLNNYIHWNNNLLLPFLKALRWMLTQRVKLLESFLNIFSKIF